MYDIFSFSIVSTLKYIIDCLSKEWDAPIYVFFKPIPSIEYIDDRKAHVFKCGVSHCRCKSRLVRRFLDKGDAKSTSNLRRHVKHCWGDETVTAADNTRDVKAARWCTYGPDGCGNTHKGRSEAYEPYWVVEGVRVSGSPRALRCGGELGRKCEKCALCRSRSRSKGPKMRKCEIFEVALKSDLKDEGETSSIFL